MQTKQFLSDLSQLFESRWTKHNSLPTPPPANPLWHYTTAEGLLGILTTHSIWATDMRYLNDTTELVHAERLIRDELDSALKIGAADVMLLLERMKASYDPPGGLERPFVSCFCDSGDLLHEWVSYGARGGGYAVGFDSTALIECVRRVSWLRLGRVLYGEEQQRERIRAGIAWICDSYRSLAPKYPALTAQDMVPWCCSKFRGDLFITHFDFKHNAFEVEQECRIVALKRSYDSQNDFPSLRFRVAKNQIIPYVPLRLQTFAGPNHRKLPIKEIRCGPTSQTTLTKVAIVDLLDELGYKFVDVSLSKLPLR